MALLVQHVEEGLLQPPHLLLPGGKLAVGDVVQLGPLDQLLYPGLVEQLQQLPVLGTPQPGLEQLDRGVGLPLLLFEERLGLGQQLIDHRGLLPDQLGDLAVELGIAGVFLVAHRTADDERGPGFVDQDRVHLVHDGVGVLPLDPLLQPEHHVVPQVVEPELVVGPVGDIREVGLPAGSAGRIGVVDAPDR